MSIGNSKNPTKSLTKLDRLPNVVVKLSQAVQKKIDYLHKIYNVEWSGFIYYKIVEGSIIADNLTLEVVDFFPLSVDSSTYTEFKAANLEASNSSEFQNLELSGLKKGVLHTHHSMGTFFSGTDQDEIYDNTPFFSSPFDDESNPSEFYLSMITNFQNAHIARVIKSATVVSKTKTSGIKNIERKIQGFNSPFFDSNEVLTNEEQEIPEVVTEVKTIQYYYRDCSIEVIDDQIVDSEFMNRFLMELGLMNKKKPTTSYPHHQTNYQNNYYQGEARSSTVAQAYNHTIFPVNSPEDLSDEDYYNTYLKGNSPSNKTDSTQKLNGLKHGIFYEDGLINYKSNIGRANGGARFYKILFRAAGIHEVQGIGAFTNVSIKTIGVSFRSELTIDKALFILYGENRPNLSKMTNHGKKNLFNNGLLLLEEVMEAAPHVNETTHNFDGAFMKLLRKIEKLLKNELANLDSEKQIIINHK